MLPNPLEIILGVFNIAFLALAIVGRFLLSIWWILVPIFLLLLVRDLWYTYIRQRFINAREWVLLEVIPPREVKKTPLAMEQFFSTMHGAQSGPNWAEKNIKGKTQDWFSMEIVGSGGEIHFLIRTPVFFRNMVEAQIYAQYPDAEITEVGDYVYNVPSDIPNEDYDLWGTELALTKEDAYPIRTYPAFTTKSILIEEQLIDPMSSMMEIMGKLTEGEHIWIQTLVRPVDDEWKKQGEKLRNKLISRVAPDKAPGEISKEMSAWIVAGRSEASKFITGQEWAAAKEEKKDEINPLLLMTKSERDIVEALENNIAKFGYEVIIRFLYIARRDLFNKVNVASVIGAYKQFGTQNLNGLKPNKRTATGIDLQIQLKKVREPYRKRRIFAEYKCRYFVQQSPVIKYLKPFFYERLPIFNWFFIKSKPFVFNTEELATVYHFPSMAVQAPMVPKIEAKKGEPPIGLPVE